MSLPPAMTGEISLVGRILPVGGLKEKIPVAHRTGTRIILVPNANGADIEENVSESYGAYRVDQ